MTADIAPGRVPPAELAANFADVHPPLTTHEALVEASRCYFCYDAPCIEACPTGIDIPTFIREIAQRQPARLRREHPRGRTSSAACAPASARPRCCASRPACATAEEDKPVEIGALQRYATDWLMRARARRRSRRGAPTGKRVAVVGAGPAGLACAHRLALHGHEVTMFEARAKLGGLNEYGIAAYKTPDDFAQREVDFILCDRRHRGRERQGARPRLRARGAAPRDYDAVFLGLGLGGGQRAGHRGRGRWRACAMRSTSSPSCARRDDKATAADRPARRRDRRRHDRDRRGGAEQAGSAPRT